MESTFMASGGVVATNATADKDNEQIQDNTTTFIIGFGILLIFILLGILASAFLCITLKKDPFLWDAERERQLEEKDEDGNYKERDKLNSVALEENTVDVVNV